MHSSIKAQKHLGIAVFMIRRYMYATTVPCCCCCSDEQLGVYPTCLDIGTLSASG